jgi:hypothetical protein
MPSRIRRAAATTAIVLVVVGCATNVSPSHVAPPSPAASPLPSPPAAAAPSLLTLPSPTPARTQIPAADCVNPPPDIAALIAQADPVACYGNAPLALDAYLIGPAQVDYVVYVQPAWLGSPSTELELVGETRKNGAPFLLVAVDPASAISMSDHVYTNVRITGHFDDPAARTCRETGRVAGMGTPAPAAGTIERCRRTFVVTLMAQLHP